ncbi:Ger(x)C family spore germination C-terminal domain-containing protein [Paenibacillus sp. RC67]|uniref:Ger(x)C family spore germination C-terminal domain-containing protein n=1 Tax=Paenibacillus sp. RC67 TaxID=3039392 RepID=UPI0024ACF628|nr:Ger(x)C family spore germination C-terminal domain-containing protein [Paenibacillus sp. RC67]
MLAINRVWLVIGAVVWLLSGCTTDRHSEQVTMMSAEDMNSPVLAIDVTDQGVMKVTGLQGVRPLAVTEDERQVVLLGEAFVARNGLPLDARRLPQEVSRSNNHPLIAVVSGAAETLLGQSSTMEQWLPELRRAELELNTFHQQQEKGPRDRFVPYVLSSDSDYPSAKVLIKTAVMRGDKPSGLYDLEDIRLLSCLDGHKNISGLSLEEMSGLNANLHCHTQWSGNGDLKTPRVNAVVTVSSDRTQSFDALSRSAAEAAMEQQFTRLLRQLQEQRVDPLDVGQVIRAQYRGVWTTDRWRLAFSRADIHVNVRLKT